MNFKHEILYLVSFHIKWPKFAYVPPTILMQSQIYVHIGQRWISENCTRMATREGINFTCLYWQ